MGIKLGTTHRPAGRTLGGSGRPLAGPLTLWPTPEMRCFSRSSLRRQGSSSSSAGLIPLKVSTSIRTTCSSSRLMRNNRLMWCHTGKFESSQTLTVRNGIVKLATTARCACTYIQYYRYPSTPALRGKFQGKRPDASAARKSVSHIQGDQLQTCRALCWDGRRREGLLRRGLGGREHRNQPQVRRPRRHEPTRSTAHTHAHTRTHARARTHAHAHHTPNARTGRATCCSSTSDA